MSGKINSLSDCLVFFDFDNTLTPFDVLDDIVLRFSIDDNWRELEQQWLEGKIGSRECLKGQLESVRISRPALLKYLKKIRISPVFKKIIPLLKKHQAGPVILSDNFHFIIEAILCNNGIKGIEICANDLRFNKDRFILSFPHTNSSCWKCAHCKTKNLSNARFNSKTKIYIGDGFSDICPAEKADIVFAKGNLLRHFRAKDLPYKRLNDLRQVYTFLKAIDVAESINR